MLTVSKESYKSAIENALTARQKEILITFSEMPDASATAEELAARLEYKGFSGANVQIGAIGKRIAEYLKLELPTYQYSSTEERDAFWTVIGPYTEKGWEMHKNLQDALLES